ncbi:MAG: tetratricopeptide repeat protein [Deltaproteobacteria bacterium]|jgi:type IV pilus biogenesis/stability protein PilW|nr:tetratricopeptide repeat protein [Deltaproteobacteria bacterium]
MLKSLTGLLAAACLVSLLMGCTVPVPADALQAGTKEEQLQAMIELGKARLIQGDLPGALSELSKAELISPGNSEIAHYLGLTYYRRKDYDKSISYYEKALSLDPSKSEYKNNLGLVYLETKDYERARAQFEACLMDPIYGRPFLAHFNLGLLEEALGNFDEAEKIYQRINVISPNYAPPFLRLAAIYFNRENYRLAADFFLNAVRIETDYVEAYWGLAESYEKLGLRDEAAEAYGKVVVLAPNTNMAMQAQSRARRVLGYE